MNNVQSNNKLKIEAKLCLSSYIFFFLLLLHLLSFSYWLRSPTYLLCVPFSPSPTLSFNHLYSIFSFEVLFSCHSSCFSLHSHFILYLHWTYFLCHFSFQSANSFQHRCLSRNLFLLFSHPSKLFKWSHIMLPLIVLHTLILWFLVYTRSAPHPSLVRKLFSALYDISIKWHNEIGRVQRLLLQAAND